MDEFYALGEDDELNKIFQTGSPRDTAIQILISLALGIAAFLTFCALRPRWRGMYSARKKQKNETITLPDLPDSFFGWILPVWRITDQQILASAGLDAYAFLTFFKLAIKFLFTTLLFSLIVIKPVHDAFPEKSRNDTQPSKPDLRRSRSLFNIGEDDTTPFFQDRDYLWMYIIFAYLFSALAIYLIISTTRKVIEVRQENLGTQHTVTDRTIRLSGIPFELQDEQKIKDFIEELDIGRVESVTLCRDWKKLDQAMVARMDTLRRLEEAHTIHSGHRTIERNRETLPISQPLPPEPRVEAASDDGGEGDATDRLINANGQSIGRPYARMRPQATIRYGYLKLRSKKVDAIHYYEEKLRKADEEIRQLRKEHFAPTRLAFVTMDSLAACQLAIQAVLDPSPLQLIASQSPAPVDVIWPNTYLSPSGRILRSWSITLLILFLTVFWSGILVALATLLNVKTIERIFPQLSDILDEHKNVRSLVNTQLPTLVASLLMVLVPYLYYWLSWYQGQLSQGDIELSAISKNFFFTFFNFFVVFTILGTVSNLYQVFEKFGKTLRDFEKVAHDLALALQKLLSFYVNFIVLQGLGLFPFRLLEAGSVSLYPIYLMGAKTPRDYAELVQPPIFNYGFYLPNALLIFIICMVYSVLRSSWQVLLAGLAYFTLGHFVYKYQLLYAMDHRQQSGGSAWGMICDRIFIGLIFFQLTTAGQLLLQQPGTFAQSVIMVPLIIMTVWLSIVYGKTYKPLLKHIALSSVRHEAPPLVDADTPPESDVLSSPEPLQAEHNVWAEVVDGTPRPRKRRVGRELAPTETLEYESRYVNPSLVAPLDGIWVPKDGPSNVETEDALIDDTSTV